MSSCFLIRWMVTGWLVLYIFTFCVCDMLKSRVARGCYVYRSSAICASHSRPKGHQRQKRQWRPRMTIFPLCYFCWFLLWWGWFTCHDSLVDDPLTLVIGHADVDCQCIFGQDNASAKRQKSVWEDVCVSMRKLVSQQSNTPSICSCKKLHWTLRSCRFSLDVSTSIRKVCCLWRQCLGCVLPSMEQALFCGVSCKHSKKLLGVRFADGARNTGWVGWIIWI